jgi:hypothetical protein
MGVFYALGREPRYETRMTVRKVAYWKPIPAYAALIAPQAEGGKSEAVDHSELIEKLKKRYGNKYSISHNYGESVTHHVGFDKHPLLIEVVAALTAQQADCAIAKEPK